ncbi:MAG: hypothetical protein KatS3mg080_0769 [Anoxybacillus sp.]|nr:MAG: hypothetical protein KatS3mg080_0769 [Anoxybacillus sp.]
MKKPMIFVIAIIFIAFLAIIPFLHVRMTIQFQHAQDNDQFTIDVRILRIFHYRFVVPLIEISKKEAGVVTEQKTTTGKDEKTTFTVTDARERLAQLKQWLKPNRSFTYNHEKVFATCVGFTVSMAYTNRGWGRSKNSDACWDWMVNKILDGGDD